MFTHKTHLILGRYRSRYFTRPGVNVGDVIQKKKNNIIGHRKHISKVLSNDNFKTHPPSTPEDVIHITHYAINTS
ncbi:hypothetical protein OIU84_001710 [Salix udensis]|uniref:Uncharacterized protein n=1 Tax=Salix udensis TaxID=889485 RepID=A0AAD6P6Y6_9ROSI|nr:hypothetical protein OIU84_001710 [Salix udensis]